MAENEERFKIILAGNSGVGKSCILTRFVDNKYQSNLLATIGVDFKFRTLKIQNQKVRLQIWDTAGTQSFRSIVSAYYRGADAIVLVYDITDKLSWKDISGYWIQQIHKYKTQHCQVMILGNKSDCKNDSQVNKSQLKNFMESQNIHLFEEVSAKTGDGIEKAFQDLSFSLLKTKKQNMHIIASKNLSLETGSSMPQKKGCCK